MADGRTPPIPDAATRPFWDAAREGRLVTKRFADGSLQWPPRARRAPGWTEEGEWVELRGTGTLWSFSVIHRSRHQFPPAPYVLAIVELDEGPHLTTNLVGVDIEQIEIGMPVRVAWEDAGDERIPVFTAVSDTRP